MQIAIYFIAFASLIGLYTCIFHLYYPLLEGKSLSWPASLLFVVESMTTVGYGELVFSNDLTMLLAIQIMLSGVIMIFIVIPLLLARFLTVLLAPTPPKKTPHALHGHTIIIGFDELTRSAIDTLVLSDHDIVIIEQDKTKALEIATGYRRRAYVIWGDYNDPATFSGAHIRTAGHVVISMGERPAANIILGIRASTEAKILAIVDNLAFDRYLRYAGAEFVLSPKHATGRLLARHAALNPCGDTPSLVPGIDRLTLGNGQEPGHGIRVVNIPVVPGCSASGRTLRDLQLFDVYGIVPLFVWKNGIFIPNPGNDTVADIATSIFLFGKAPSIEAAVRDLFTGHKGEDALAVIAGYGDVGRSAHQELMVSGMRCTVVDSRLHMEGQVVGNAEDEEVLTRTSIQDAKVCIVALNQDDVNIFTTLMARNLNPSVQIMARANEPSSVEKLYRAGADYVALLPRIGGQTIARIVLSGTVAILLDLPHGEMVVVKEARNACGRVGVSMRKTGVHIIGIESATRTIVMPGADEVLSPGDNVFAVGTPEQLRRFIRSI
jgi:Trk K+ transport system NAD-binding subunit